MGRPGHKDRRVDPAVAGIAAAATLALLVLAPRYGPHRDELYFVVVGQHPAWGYPDQPALIPLLAAALDALAPGSLVVLRSVSALIVGVVVLLSAGLARELGGGRWAQVVTALVIATAPGVLAVGHLLSTSTLDLLVWIVLIRLVVAAVRRDRPRLCLAAGVVLGVGLHVKNLPLLLAAGLAVAALALPALRGVYRSPWAWAGAGVAVLLWLPNLLWQARAGWPQLTLGADIADETRSVGGLVSLVALQFALPGVVGGYLMVTGIAARSRLPVAFRMLCVAYAVVLALLLVTGGKPYYTLGLLAALVAGGSVVAAERLGRRGRRGLLVTAGVLATPPLPLALPVVPASVYAASPWAAMNDDQLNTIGWPEYVASVRAVVDGLPAAERAGAVIVTGNYGEAGAWSWYTGGEVPAYSGHNGMADLGPPADESGPVIVVDDRDPDPTAFTGCADRGPVATPVETEETGARVWVCTGPTVDWAQTWDLVRHLSA